MTTQQNEAQIICLEHYQPTDFEIKEVHLHFELTETHTEVQAVLAIKRRPGESHAKAPVQLFGEELILKTVAINGKVLAETDYQVDAAHLTIPNVPDEFTLETAVTIHPETNTALSGLYKSSGNFCTQCEPHGFRRITYYLDRPDVLSRFTTTISADKERYPMLLANGNLVEEKELADNRHWVKWVDPSLKPCYLFALVAGHFDLLEDTFVTCSGRNVALKLYLERGYRDQGHYALGALKRSMKWDEEAFGREYDLDIYMIVAVSDFNMGAMENKGLNIFNTKYILAKPETATDQDYYGIEKVIGHEYFHNWSGNRITCRDWFQITLKEGFTVFRDQCFSADLNSAAYERIYCANVIRNVQFVQDAGPMSHPIRPVSYIEINNFYTVTVYNKGAEVIRMIKTILGPALFRKGTDLYFERHDGQAVTTEDFVQVMEDVSDIDLSQFQRWYSQGGTPILTVTGEYSALQKKYTLHVKQSCPDTPGQTNKLPFHIPLAVGLITSKGVALPLQLVGETIEGPTSRVLHITEPSHAFTFVNISAPVVPSLLRDFSAPVKIQYPYSLADLRTLFEHDQDPFARWDAGQRYATQILLQLAADYQAGRDLVAEKTFIKAISEILASDLADLQLKAMLLTLPGMAYLIQQMGEVDVAAMHYAREFLIKALAESLTEQWRACYNAHISTIPYQYNSAEMGRRSLLAVCLQYLVHAGKEGITLARTQYEQADNMTDRMAALGAVNLIDCKEREAMLDGFYESWQHEPLVVDKWLTLKASAPFANTAQVVRGLLQHPAFSIKNPNKVLALMRNFGNNLFSFHQPDGSGYDVVTDVVIQLDKINPQTASRVLEPLTHWRHYSAAQQQMMRAALEKIQSNGPLSKDCYEIVSKSLAEV